MDTNFGHYSWDHRPNGGHQDTDDTLWATLNYHTALLQRLLAGLEQPAALPTDDPGRTGNKREERGGEGQIDGNTSELFDQNIRLLEENDQLRSQLEQLHRERDDQQRQLQQAADEYRQQAERDAAEIDALKRSLGLCETTDAMSSTGGDGTDDTAVKPPTEAFGEVSTNDLFASNEAIEAERARLAELQTQCEQQVREIEIRSSLDRAKLSRENSDLRHQNEELQRELKDLERRAALPGENGGRRWMAKLGLTGEEDDA